MSKLDIPDYLADPSPDGNEWIKRKALASRWKLRRIIEEVEFFASQYQMKKKYSNESQELPEIEKKLRSLFEQSRQLAVQLRDMSS